MRILAVVELDLISNTGRFRVNSLSRMGHEVDVIDSGVYEGFQRYAFRVRNKLFKYGLPVHLKDKNGENNAIINYMKNKKYDILWVEKELTISAKTLLCVREISPDTIFVNVTLDNMALRFNQSQNYLDCLGLYDYHITTKSYIVNQLKKIGAPNVIFTYQSFEDTFHYPRVATKYDIEKFGADVGFVGSWEKERMESILYLTRNGIQVRVFGNKKWNICRGDNPNLIIEDHGLFEENYAISFSCFKICLCFLRKINYDQHTSRTMEIPACGAFMLAERTEEHKKLFEEGVEAEFFESNEELLEKCKYYLLHDDARKAIAEAGRKRCLNSGYSNVETYKKVIEQIVLDRKQKGISC